MFADATIGPHLGDTFLDAIVNFMQRVAQVLFGVLDLNLCF
jgi:hypothetical protein